MSETIVAIRPQPGLAATIATGRALGLDILGEPLSEIRPLEWTCPDPDTVDALLIGSANAFLHGGPQLAELTGKPVYAVGNATADAARSLGFKVAAIGTGGLQNVLDTVAPPTRLLRIAGARHVPLVAPEGVAIHTVIAYENVALPIPERMVEALQAPVIVLLHSAASALNFASECDRLALDRSRISLAALGPRIVADIGSGWRSVYCAPSPNDRDLLEMVGKLCV